MKRAAYFHRKDTANIEKRGGGCVSDRRSEGFSHSHATSKIVRFCGRFSRFLPFSVGQVFGEK